MSPPVVVEVEIGTRCNLSCSYCPNSVLSQPKDTWIALALFDSILDQLAEMTFCGRFSFHLYNEPLLHRDLEALVERVRHKLPEASPVLFTNGTGLSDRRHRTLSEAGVERFIVTRHHGAALLPDRPNQIQFVSSQLRLTNRGGLLSSLDYPLRRPCHAPLEMLIVTVEGDVLHCFEDARRRRVMGNLRDQSLRDIWFGTAFMEARRILAEGRRDHFPDLCALCDNTDYPRPGLTEGTTCTAP